jgi:hypothetical protein
LVKSKEESDTNRRLRAEFPKCVIFSQFAYL